MKRKEVSGIMLTLLLIGLLSLAFNIQPVRAEPKTWYVDDDGGADFTKIQEAIYAASPGDTIYVYNGIYYERLIVNKQNLTIIGENKSNTIVDGSGIAAVIRVWMDRVAISGFTVRNSGWGWYYYLGSGIFLDYAVKSCIISDNIVTNTRYGISQWLGTNNTIHGNMISNGEQGISFDRGGYAIVDRNLISNVDWGISLYTSPCNVISGNTVSHSAVSAIQLNSHSNIISGNNILDVVEVGIVLWQWLSAYNNTIVGNVISDVGLGVGLEAGSYNNTVDDNTVSDSDTGIQVGPQALDNIITGNNLSNNGIGISVFDNSNNNKLYHNNFVGNTFQTSVWGSYDNVWDDGYPSGGNYWSDYIAKGGYDADGDGIGDIPYIIDANNQDNYPLMEPWTPLPRNIDELKTEVEELGSEGQIDNQGIVKSLIAKLDVAEELIDMGRLNEAKRVLECFITQVKKLTSIRITEEAADILIQSAEYILSHL